MKDVTKKYSNGDITIVWKPSNCIHSAICFNGLPSVFNPAVRPWISMEATNSEDIIDQVNRCPSGALSYFKNIEEEQVATESETIIEVMEKGPLLVYGNLTVKNGVGEEIKKSKVTAFCRCGASSNKPFCDGSHVSNKFSG